MRTVRIDKRELLVVVGDNRNAHREVFVAAVEAYRSQALIQLQQRIDEIMSGKQFVLGFALPVPEDHTADYDEVLRMLDMSVDEVVELDQQEFQQFVMDDWSWTRAWQSSTASYMAT